MYRLLKRGLFIVVVWGLPVVCLVLGVRSWWFTDILGYSSNTGIWCIGSNCGGVVIFEDAFRTTSQLREEVWQLADAPGNWTFVINADHELDASRASWVKIESSPDQYLITIPWWTITLITLLPAMFIYFPGRRKRRRRKLGLCTRCGYDLRGQSDDSSGCPECGTAAV